VVGLNYDPMLAKVIAWGPDRMLALRRLDLALAETAILGFTTNVSFLRALLSDEDVRAGRLDTDLVGRKLAALVESAPQEHFFLAAALDQMLSNQSGKDTETSIVDPWDSAYGWRLGSVGRVGFIFRAGDEQAEVQVEGVPNSAIVRVNGGPAKNVTARLASRHVLEIECDGEFRRYHRATGNDDSLWLMRDGHSCHLVEYFETQLLLGKDNLAGPVVSPMPGTVLMVKVKQGDQVRAGDPLLVVEAMKMEHIVTASADGIVDEVKVRSGDRVLPDEVLVVMSAVDPPAVDSSAFDSSAVSAPATASLEEEAK